MPVRYSRKMLLGVLLPVLALLAGCQSARVGVGQPRAFLYKNVTTPYTAKRPDFRRGETALVIPDNLQSGTARFYYVGNPPFVIPGPPGTAPISVGWGDASNKIVMERAGIGEIIYGDVNELEILGVFTRITITVYGLPPGAEPPAHAGAPPGGGPPTGGPPLSRPTP